MPINDSSALKFQPESEDLPDREPLGTSISMELPEEAVAILNGVMRTTGDSVETLFRRALGLYTMAIDAKLDGCKLAIVDAEDNEFVQDIPGL